METIYHFKIFGNCGVSESIYFEHRVMGGFKIDIPFELFSQYYFGLIFPKLECTSGSRKIISLE